MQQIFCLKTANMIPKKLGNNWKIYTLDDVLRRLRKQRVMPSSHHRQDEKTVFSSPHRISRLEKQFQNFMSPTVLTCCQFCSHRRYGQDKTRPSCVANFVRFPAVQKF